MSTKSTLKQDHKSEINERSEGKFLKKKWEPSKHWIALFNMIKTGAD